MAEEKKMTTALSQWSNTVTDLVVDDFREHGEGLSEYSKTCALNAMASIFELAKSSNIGMNDLDTSNLRMVVGECASLKLNANAFPRECYFTTRSKKVGDKWVKTVELGIESAGMESLMRNFGVGIDTVYDWWVVHEGDDFAYPRRKGLEVAPPEWEEKGLSQKVSKVVLPVKKTDGTVTYLISEREGVKVNLKAHVKNNLMNETFGICADRYKATDKQKEEIKAKKEEIYKALDACETLDDMLACESAKPYISDAWSSSTESMILTKLKNNTIRKYPKNFSNMANKSFIETDEVYKASIEETEENANTIPFEENVVATVSGEIVNET